MREFISTAQYKCEGRISLISFAEFLLNNRDIFNPIFRLQFKIIKDIIGVDLFNIIQQRQRFYDNNPEMEFRLPPENCLFHIYRVVFTSQPNQYTCDFKPQTKWQNIDSIVARIRQRYSPNFRSSNMSSLKHLKITYRKAESQMDSASRTVSYNSVILSKPSSSS